MQSSIQREEDSSNYLRNNYLLPLRKNVLGPRGIVLRNDSWGISMGENAKECQELGDKEGKTQMS